MTDRNTPQTTSDWILGRWQLLRCEAALDLEPGTRMEFEADARLEYTIPTATGPLRVPMRWRLDGDVLHTQLDDGTNPVQVIVSLGDAEVLTFNFAGPRAWFVRAG